MAEGKKSFVAYCDWGDIFDELNDVESGILVKHLFDYVRDKNPVAKDQLTKMMFIQIKQSLKRDLVKYDKYIDKQKINGAKGGRPKKTQITQPFIEKPKKADSVNVSVSVIDNVNDILNRETEFKNSLQPYLEIYGSSLLNEFYLYWTEKKPKGRKMLFEMQKTFDISRRLKRWDKNNFKSKEKFPPKKEKKDAAQIILDEYGISNTK